MATGKQFQTYFIRHSSRLDISTKFKEQLYVDNKIFIHYPHNTEGNLDNHDNKSLDPNDYTNRAGNIIRRLLHLGKSGGFVYADYGKEFKPKIGYVKPHSEVEVIKGKWGNKYNLAGRVTFVKALTLSNVLVLQPTDAAIFKLSRPRQGTLSKWRAIGNKVAIRLTGAEEDFNLSYLTATHQEVMCGEFLRKGLGKRYGLPKITSYLTPIGRTMADVDILGLDESNNVVAVQVTYLGQNKSKLDKLKQFQDEDGTKVVYFGNVQLHTNENGIDIFPLATVYKDYCIDHDEGRRWLSKIQ